MTVKTIDADSFEEYAAELKASRAKGREIIEDMTVPGAKWASRSVGAFLRLMEEMLLLDGKRKFNEDDAPSADEYRDMLDTAATWIGAQIDVMGRALVVLEMMRLRTMEFGSLAYKEGIRHLMEHHKDEVGDMMSFFKGEESDEVPITDMPEEVKEMLGSLGIDPEAVEVRIAVVGEQPSDRERREHANKG